MNFDCNVIRNGVLYPAGTDVPVGEPAKAVLEEETKTDELKTESEPEKPRRGRKPKEA